jgi:hypothetical protein
MGEDVEEMRLLIRRLPEMAREELLSLWQENAPHAAPESSLVA